MTTNAAPTTPRYLGQVKLFHADKNWGFIQVLMPEGHSDVFVHGSSAKVVLIAGEYVEFGIELNKKTNKMNAVNVTGLRGGKLLLEFSPNLFGGNVVVAPLTTTAVNTVVQMPTSIKPPTTTSTQWSLTDTPTPSKIWATK